MTHWYPDMAEQALRCLHERTRHSLTLFVESAGYLPDWDVILMQTAYCIEPKPLSPALLIERIPYARPDSFVERLMAAVRRGWLQEKCGSFYLTDRGREIVEGIYELGDRLCAKIKTLKIPEMEYLCSLYDHIIENIKQLSEPLAKPAFELSLNYKRNKSTPLIVKICQRIIVLLAFRDDAHVAAWRSCEPDGHIWEVFTMIWRDSISSPAELVRQLPHRNFMESDYAAVLEELKARNWIIDCEDQYVVLDEAAQMRQQVEVSTDETFDHAFTCLNLYEMEKFQELMGKFAVKICA